jgi:hypothetical protein
MIKYDLGCAKKNRAAHVRAARASYQESHTPGDETN